MKMSEAIYKRKSVRSYTDEKVKEEDLQKVKDFIENVKPLNPDIKVIAEIIGRDEMKSVLPLPWLPKQHIAIYSEDKEGAFENVGFMFQQVDLYLQSIGMGACWLGLGRLNDAKGANKEGMRFIIMLSFGYPKDSLRNDADELKRKSLSEISDVEDERLEPARLAPSAVNSQPWYFVHEGDCIRAYRTENKMLRDMNRIDMGISLAHLYVSNPETFCYYKEDGVKAIKGYEYTGSFYL